MKSYFSHATYTPGDDYIWVQHGVTDYVSPDGAPGLMRDDYVEREQEIPLPKSVATLTGDDLHRALDAALEEQSLYRGNNEYWSEWNGQWETELEVPGEEY